MVTDRQRTVPRVECVGTTFLDQIFWDLLAEPRPGTEVFCRRLVLCPGGVTTTAIALARLGCETSLQSILGRDPMGDHILAKLREQGVDVSRVAQCRAWPTPITASLTRRGERSLVTYLAELSESERAVFNLGTRAQADLVFLSIPWDQRRSFRVNQEPSAPPCFVDFGWVPEPNGLLPYLRSGGLTFAGVLPNESEALSYTGTSDLDKAIARLLEVVPTVVVKRGARGAIARNASGAEVVVPGIEVISRDTTGAGDVFNAGFLSARAAGLSLAAQVALGVVASAISVQYIGSSTSAPCLREAEQLLHESPNARGGLSDEVRQELGAFFEAQEELMSCECNESCALSHTRTEG